MAEKEIPRGSEESVPPLSIGAVEEDSTEERAIEPSRPDSPLVDPRRQSRVPSAKVTGFSKTPTAAVQQQPKKVVKSGSDAAERREALPFDAKRKFFEKEIEYAQQIQTSLPAKKTPEVSLPARRLSPFKDNPFSSSLVSSNSTDANLRPKTPEHGIGDGQPTESKSQQKQPHPGGTVPLSSAETIPIQSFNSSS